MLSRSSSRRHGHHGSHHHHNHTPREYSDLTKADIALLAPILAPPPAPNTSAAATYEADTKQLIADLPQHLRAKIPKLSTFCKVHEKLNPLPLIDLLSVIQNELHPEKLERWAETELPTNLLANANAIWMKPETFTKHFGKAPVWEFADHKCAACKLATLARNPEIVAAVGSITIARLDPKNWKKSKRILFFEEWLKVLSDWRLDASAPIEEMWERGVRLSEVAKQKKSGDGSRPWVDEFVKRATGKQSAADPAPSSPRDVAAPPEEQNPFIDPPTTPTTTIADQMNPFEHPDDDDGRFVDSLFPSDGRHAGHEFEHGSAVPEPLHPSRPAASSVYDDDERSRLVRTPASTMNGSVRAASSIYSRRPDERASFLTENEVIEAYRGSGVKRPVTPSSSPRQSHFHAIEIAAVSERRTSTMARRTRRLLDLKKANPATQEITQRNEQESPLFSKLPPEIRSRIYHYALGGHKLTVAARRHRGSACVYDCKRNVKLDNIYEVYKATGVAPVRDFRHGFCCKRSSIGVSLQLLSVCRSIYTECALIPFSANTFIVEHIFGLDLLRKLIMPAQQRAIRELYLTCVDADDLPNSRDYQNFTSLRHVQVVVDFSYIQEDLESAHQRCRKSLLHFGQGGLASAKVITREQRGMLASQKTRQWASELEDEPPVASPQLEEEKQARSERRKELAEHRAEQHVQWKQGRGETRSTRSRQALED